MFLCHLLDVCSSKGSKPLTPALAILFYGALTDFQKKLMAIFLTNLKSYFATHELQTNQVKLSAGY
ncbi:hypothetical protein B1P88_04985 [Enterococcus faecium]|nr:hypothetical protein B1P88_04985 [Enterococcus faecium]